MVSICIFIHIAINIAFLLLIDYLLLSLGVHMFSHNGYGAGTKAQGPRGWVPQVPVHSSLGLGPYQRVLGRGPIHH